MLQVLGLNPAYVIAGAAAVGLLLVVFVSVLAGPGVILDGAFGLLSQTVTTASTTLGSLIATSGTVIAQGMSIPSTIVSQAGLIIGNAIAGSVAAMNTVFSIATAAVASAGQIVASIVATASQIVAGGAAMVANIITSGAAAITSIYFAIQSATIQLGTVVVQNAIMALGAYYRFVTTAVAQITGSLFTALAAILGQFLSIPMITLFGYVSVGTTIAGLIPQITVAGFSVFTSLFNSFYEFFVEGRFIEEIEKLPTKITEGFTSLISALPGILKTALFST